MRNQKISISIPKSNNRTTSEFIFSLQSKHVIVIGLTSQIRFVGRASNAKVVLNTNPHFAKRKRTQQVPNNQRNKSCDQGLAQAAARRTYWCMCATPFALCAKQHEVAPWHHRGALRHKEGKLCGATGAVKNQCTMQALCLQIFNHRLKEVNWVNEMFPDLCGIVNFVSLLSCTWTCLAKMRRNLPHTSRGLLKKRPNCNPKRTSSRWTIPFTVSCISVVYCFPQV